MIEEYVLTNGDGEKIYLHFSNSGKKAVINSVSINDYEKKGNPYYIDKKELVDFIRELINSKGEPAAYGNSKVKHFVNKELMKPLVIKGKPYPDDFVESIYGRGYKFKNCEKIQRLSTPVKDKIELLKQSSINRFQFFSNSSSFNGRTAELRYLIDMCENTNTSFLWVSICGKGGTGKSRLALELCERLSKNGWIVYPPAHARIKAEQIKNDIEKTDTDMVICFDDVNSDIENVLNFINYCIETPFKQNQKIRLILIDRDFEHSPLLSSNALLYRYQSNGIVDAEVTIVNGSLELKKPLPNETFDIMHSFVENVYKKDLPRLTFEEILYPSLQEIDKNERPLFALLLADAWGYVKQPLAEYKYQENIFVIQNDILDMLYLLECNRIRELINIEYKKPSEQAKALEAAKCCITLSSFLDESELSRHKKFINEMEHFEADDSFCWVMEQAGFVKDRMLINPFPDILAEYFSLLYINSFDIKNKDLLILLIEHLLKEGKTRTLNFAAQICDDNSDTLSSPSNMSIFQYLTEMYKDIHYEQRKFLYRLNTNEDNQHPITNDSEYISFIEQLRIKFCRPVDYGCNFDKPIGDEYLINDHELEKDFSKYSADLVEALEKITAELIIDFFEQNKDKVFILSDDPILHGALSSSKYHGQILFDLRCGKGRFEDYIGIYDGEWNMNTPYGKGEMIYYNGGKYTGEWNDGHMSGYGKMRYDDDTEYEGEWSLGLKNGHGRITRPDKVSYECEWEYEVPKGDITMAFPEDKIVKGLWHNGTTEKIWEFEYGISYDDKIFLPDDSTYIGEINDSKQDGMKVLTLFDGRIYEGELKDGLPNGSGNMTWPQWWKQSKKEYSGSWKGGRFHGKGIMIYADGSVYDGNWENNERSGEGTMTYVDGRIYSGKWEHDHESEFDIRTSPDGTQFIMPIYKKETHTEDDEY